MRIWSLHPRYLDRQALIAGWREALLAKAVLGGLTRGYKHHPQLLRFQQHPDPLQSINTYLDVLYNEAVERGYRFDRSKVGALSAVSTMDVNTGQIEHEWAHLLQKVASRSPEWLPTLSAVDVAEAHPLFIVVPGPIASWERTPRG
ncbi:MAG TPA: pyrimidine dimer DNA glycosylase/endonuclease V [Gemmatimonadaceae bacterium]